MVNEIIWKISPSSLLDLGYRSLSHISLTAFLTDYTTEIDWNGHHIDNKYMSFMTYDFTYVLSTTRNLIFQENGNEKRSKADTLLHKGKVISQNNHKFPHTKKKIPNGNDSSIVQLTIVLT
jgi:hypothetical protein